MEPFKFLTKNPKVLYYSTVGHKLYGGIGLVNDYADNGYVDIGWISYDGFPTDYDYSLPTSIDDLIILKK